MEKQRKTVAVYTILHFLVDFTTIFLISGVLLGQNTRISDRGSIIILYNLIAFAGQLPMGIMADVINKDRLFAAVGCLLAGTSYIVVAFAPWTACILAALGNGAFHIGAGCEVMKVSMPESGCNGIFVSSGALGVWLAYKVGGDALLWIFPIVMALAFLLLLLWHKKNNIKENYTIKFEKPKNTVVTAVSFFMLTIVIRSLIGMIMNFSWKTVPVFSFLAVVAVVMGKALGGVLGDKFGYTKTAMITLGISFLCFALGFDFWITGLIGILCFNMTMPLTLTAIANASGNKYGFSFGLTTFALAIGFLPTVFGASALFTPVFLCGSVLVSMILMLCGYSVLKK